MPTGSLSFTLIQTELYWEDKAANLAMLQQKIAAMPKHSGIVILPEMFSTGFTMNAEALAEAMDGPTVLWMKEVAASYKIILTGSMIYSSKGEDNSVSFFNRLIWMLPNGQYGFYDKRHLFAFAGEEKYYSAGNKRLIASVNGWKINLQICYDLRFPVWARQSLGEADAEPEYDVLVYIANWPERRSHAWKTLLQARAIENQCYVIGVNRTGSDGNDIQYNGDSMIVDPLGEVLYHKSKLEDVFTITLEKKQLQEIRQNFPFLKDRDSFNII